MTYIATFYSHYGAIQFRKNCEKMNLKAVVMPVPRNLSSSCGTVCSLRRTGYFRTVPRKQKQIVRVEERGYVSIYQADEE